MNADYDQCPECGEQFATEWVDNPTMGDDGVTMTGKSRCAVCNTEWMSEYKYIGRIEEDE